MNKGTYMGTFFSFYRGKARALMKMRLAESTFLKVSYLSNKRYRNKNIIIITIEKTFLDFLAE